MSLLQTVKKRTTTRFLVTVGGSLVLVLSLAGSAGASTVTLGFASLPSAQGWSYVSDGASEASIFSVSGGVLTQDTDDFAGATTIQQYQRSAVSPSLQFTISVRARVLGDSSTGLGQPNAFGFCFMAFTGTEGFGIGLDTSRIQGLDGPLLSMTIDNTLFHDYRLVATPGVGYAVYVDNVLLATGPPINSSQLPGLLILGDCTRGQGALAEVTAYSFSQGLPVGVDIKPGGFANSINIAKKGVVPVAVLGTPTFDASDVDPTTVCFGDAEDASQRDCTVAPGTKLLDVNADTIPDLILHFETQQTGIDPGDTQACLTGELVDGTSIQGCDSVKAK